MDDEQVSREQIVRGQNREDTFMWAMSLACKILPIVALLFAGWVIIHYKG